VDCHVVGKGDGVTVNIDRVNDPVGDWLRIVPVDDGLRVKGRVVPMVDALSVAAELGVT